MLFLDLGFGICMSNAMQSAEQLHSENRQFVLFWLPVQWPIKIRHFPSCALFSTFLSYLHSFIAKLKVLFQDHLIYVFLVVSFVVNCTHTNQKYFRAVASFLVPILSLSLSFLSYFHNGIIVITRFENCAIKSTSGPFFHSKFQITKQKPKLEANNAQNFCHNAKRRRNTFTT